MFMFVFTDADYVNRETERSSISGVAIMLAGARNSADMTLSTTEGKYVAPPEGANRGQVI